MTYDFTATGAMRYVSSNTGRAMPVVHKTGRPWGNTWKLDTMTDALLSLSGAKTGGTVGGGAAIDLLAAQVDAIIRNNLKTAWQAAVLQQRGTINMATRDKEYIGADKCSFQSFNLRTGSSKWYFLNLLGFMKKTGINKTGPLGDILSTLANWYDPNRLGEFNYTFTFTWR